MFFHFFLSLSLSDPIDPLFKPAIRSALAGSLSSFTSSRLDSFIAEHFSSSSGPLLDPTIDDRDIEISSPSAPRPQTRDPNLPFELALLSQRPHPTPAPSLTSTCTKRAPLNHSSSPLRVLHDVRKRPLDDTAFSEDYPMPDDDDYDYPYHHDYDDYDYHSRPDEEYDDPAELDLDAPFDDRLNTIERWARPKFEILSVSPNSCSIFKGCAVALKIEPAVEGLCYCKFGAVLVKGIVNESGFVICRAPPHEIGVCQLQFSKDRKNWFGAVEFSFTVSSGLESLAVFAPVGVAMMIVCVIGIWGLSAWAKGRAEANMREMGIVKRSRR